MWDAGVTRSDFEAAKEDLIKAALNDACTATNPRKATPEDVAMLLGKITP